MAKPKHPASAFLGKQRCFFVTAQCAQGRAVLQSERMASLLIAALRRYAQQGRFVIHDFVVMPNHVHILLTVPPETSVETAVQIIKGGFSYRAGKELGHRGEVWQRGFSDVYVPDRASFLNHRKYIDQNPVRAGLASAPEQYPFGSAYLKKLKFARAKARQLEMVNRHD